MFGSTMRLLNRVSIPHGLGQALRISPCATPMTCQQFQHSPNLFGDCEAYGVSPTKRFYPMWPSSVLLHIHLFIRLVFIKDGIRVSVVVGVLRVFMT